MVPYFIFTCQGPAVVLVFFFVPLFLPPRYWKIKKILSLLKLITKINRLVISREKNSIWLLIYEQMGPKLKSFWFLKIWGSDIEVMDMRNKRNIFIPDKLLFILTKKKEFIFEKERNLFFKSCIFWIIF